MLPNPSSSNCQGRTSLRPSSTVSVVQHRSFSGFQTCALDWSAHDGEATCELRPLSPCQQVGKLRSAGELAEELRADLEKRVPPRDSVHPTEYGFQML